MDSIQSYQENNMVTQSPGNLTVMLVTTFITIAVVVLGTASLGLADHGPQDTPTQDTPTQDQPAQDQPAQDQLTQDTPASFMDRDTLTDNWFGLGKHLEQTGISVSLGLTQIYQQNLEGGNVTNRAGQRAGVHRHRGRYTGSFDLEGEIDFTKLLNWPGASIYLHAEGGWSEGLDVSSIGSIFGVNADAIGAGNNPDQAINLSELYFEQSLFGDRLIIRMGKLDMTGGFECSGCPVAFDGNAYANDETAQFLNGALVNNPTIPFPDYSLGAVVYAEPFDGVYVAAGVADAQGDGRETGFNTAFHGTDYYIALFETGLAPVLAMPWGDLQGTYRVGMWYDPQPKERFSRGSIKRDDAGFYLSFDQQLWKENQSDDQGLGLFARYGWADREVNEIGCFWSLGGQYQGLIPTRDDDVLGAGFAQGIISDYIRDEDSASYEAAFEVYYNAQITGWLSLTPSVQFVRNPGGVSAHDATVIGLRLQMSF